MVAHYSSCWQIIDFIIGEHVTAWLWKAEYAYFLSSKPARYTLTIVPSWRNEKCMHSRDRRRVSNHRSVECYVAMAPVFLRSIGGRRIISRAPNWLCNHATKPFSVTYYVL